MRSLNSRQSNGSKREYSPTEFKMLDTKGKEIVEILKEEGTIKKYPPIRHSPPLEPRKIIYSPNYKGERDHDPRILSPEVELEHQSIHVSKNMYESPFKNKENVAYNTDQNSKIQNTQFHNTVSPNFEIPPPISFTESQYPPQFAQTMPFNGYYQQYAPQEQYYQPMQPSKFSGILDRDIWLQK
jgi:hypothetical protein